jgi:hypothetical protein
MNFFSLSFWCLLTLGTETRAQEDLQEWNENYKEWNFEIWKEYLARENQ